MKRKIVKLGNSSYVITLPKEWVKKNNIDSNSKIDLDTFDDNIIISLSTQKPEKEYIINYQEYPLKVLIKKIISVYLKNYEKIIIRGKRVSENLETIKQILSKINLLQIYEISEDEIILKDLSDTRDLDILELLKTIEKTINKIFGELTSEEINFKFITELDSNINKLTYLCFKHINSKLDDLKEKDFIKNTVNYWRIIFSLENIGDILKRIARYVHYENYKLNPEIKNLIELTRSYFNKLLDNIENRDKKVFSELLDDKQRILREIEELKLKHKDTLNLFLVITQLIKDILGKLDLIMVSVIDLEE